jgi:protoporphyrinogen oxidase
VLGAGISGLAAARALQELGRTPEVLEVCPEVGGLTRTTIVGGFAFDYTGHLLHLARHESPSGIPFAGLRDDEWKRVERRSYCYVGGKLVPAPIQYHIGDLPPTLREECIASYEARPVGAMPERSTFRDFIVHGFGRSLADHFLIPQNEKTLATPLDRLSPEAMRRFFPLPDEGKVRLGMTPETIGPAEYNSRFWYPTHGGIARLVAGLARGVRRIRLSTQVASLNLSDRSLRTATGQDVRWDFLLSSIPLVTLCRLSGDPDLVHLASKLTHSTTVCINLGTRGPLGAAMQDAQWIYVPDRSVPFYRVGAYSHISDGVCPSGHSSVYVEVGLPSEEADRPGLVADLEPRVCNALHDLGWVRREAVVCRVTHLIRCAYVHLTPERETVLPAIVERLERHGVFPIGRYGTWDYTSMEDSILSGIDTARRVAG